MSDSNGLGERLRQVLVSVLDDGDVSVRDLRRLTGGASRETWYFRAVGARGEARELILRRDPPALPRVDGISVEARAIATAARAGVPEPAVLTYGDDRERLGAPFMIMDFLEGETLGRRILRDERYAPARAKLASQCGDILARIHAVDPAAVPGLGEYDPLHTLAETLHGFAEPSPAFELALRWLAEHRPPRAERALVHGDFRNGNLLVGPEGVRAVLDWELVHAGDPMEDLGWLCVRAWRFGGSQPVGGFGAREELFAAYEARSGRAIDPEVVRWWEVLGTVRWGVSCMSMSAEHLSGVERSVELAAIGRRTWEQEYDALLALEGR